MAVVIKSDEVRKFNPLTIRIEDQENFDSFIAMLKFVHEEPCEFDQFAGELLKEIQSHHS